MPGARLRNFRFGDNAELLAEFVLNTFAFTTRVPRQEDVGHDLFCSLTERDGNLLRAGPFFTVQIKSDRSELVFEADYETAWLRKQDNPFFICVTDRNNLSIDLYSTWNLYNGYLYRTAEKIVLVPGNPEDEFQFPRTSEDRKEQIVPLGKPFLSVTVADVMDEVCVENCRGVVRDWLEVERKNIANRDVEMYWIVGPQNYETNKCFDKDTLALSSLFWHGKNINVQIKNFGRVATELRLTIRHAFQEHESEKFPANQLEDLDQILKSYSEYLEPVAKQALLNEIGIDL